MAPSTPSSSERVALVEARRYAVATAIALALAFAPIYFESTPSTVKGLLVPFAMLASAYLVFFATPLRIGRLLAVAPWSSRSWRIAAYAVWAVSLTPLGSDFSASAVIRTASALPTYVNSHGFAVAASLSASVLAYVITRHLPVRLCDLFSLLPTLCGGAALLFSPYLRADLDLYPNLPLYMLLVSAVSCAAYLAALVKPAPAART